MSATLLDGKILAGRLKKELTAKIASIKSEHGVVPSLVNILIGDNQGSCAYARSQKSAAEAVGIHYDLKIFPDDISQKDLIAYVQSLNADPSVHGIMLHKPVPKHIDYHVLANHVDMEKDLEGINVGNIGKMILGETRIIPCTPASVMEHIKSTGIDLRGKEAVIIGHSVIVGKPLSLLLLEKLATVTICHIATSEAGRLIDHIRRADVLVVAAGKAGLVKGEWIKEGAVVIDVGINRVDGKIVGDVDFDSAKEKAGFLTPVPGGVGPVTVVMLMRNGVEACMMQLNKEMVK